MTTHLIAQAHRGQPISPTTAAAPRGLLSPLLITPRTQAGADEKNDDFHSAPLAWGGGARRGGVEGLMFIGRQRLISTAAEGLT